MEDYLHYSATQLAEIEDFIVWVKYPGQNPEIDLFWKEWVRKNPQKEDELNEARSIILALISEDDSHSTIPQQQVWERLQKSLDFQPAKKQRSLAFLKVAVLFLLAAVITVGTWLILQPQSDKALSSENEFVKEINNGSNPKTIILGDGSTIVLEPKSYLQYPVVFKETAREIKLEGEAFFEIAKQLNRPFIVYSDQLVTRVTGTSFTVRDFKGEDNVFVKVRTGKVSVFTKSDVEANQRKSDQQLEGVFLTPNQQASFSKEDSKLVKSLVENPILLAQFENETFEFKDTKLEEVFNLIENAYGVEIIYDEELMGACQLNASLKDMTLQDKMRLICKGINSKYEIMDSKIIVQGKGCK